MTTTDTLFPEHIEHAATTGIIPDDLQIKLSDEALSQALSLQASEYEGSPLRIYIEGKGCDGFFYGVSFAAQETGDVSYFQGQLKIILDQQSFKFLAGSTVEWVDDERGRGFLVSNPNQRKYRGKFFKRQAWKDGLEKLAESQNG